ncbi:hypothetical protein [Salinicola peritrichatus]|uniref:hypothetical protein n=1 Tax=Salinicola peritrichatus TaxID=1267424 RepID=UPI0013A65B3A|nr:hypothetical protein [Salinicola peritrichatus]
MIIQVSSHRRSGTHALIDLIRNNFSVQGDFFHLEDILDWSLERLNELPLIVKTHEPEPEKKLNLFIKQGRVTEEKAQDIKDMTVDVHAYRHPKDVLKSLYYFNIKGHEPVYQIPEGMAFLEFMKQEGAQDASPSENRIQFWQRCIRSWVFNKSVVSVGYNAIVDGDESLKEMLSQKFDLISIFHSRLDDKRIKRSTAIGRGTTKSMEGSVLWSEACESFYQKEIDMSLLRKLNLE